MVQSDDMANDAVVTVRIPAPLKRRLEARARQAHRSVSAQVLHDLQAATDAADDGSRRGRFLGLYAGTQIPTDAEIRDVRARLWGRLRGSTRHV